MTRSTAGCKFENRLEIVPGKDRFGLPLMTVNFNRTEQELANAQENLDLMTKVIVEMGYEVVYSKTEDPGAHHTTGTCRMGKTPEESVTDANLKVHGISNLYLCSNGVFPSGSAVNPTLTLTALSMRLADNLIEQAKTKKILNNGISHTAATAAL